VLQNAAKHAGRGASVTISISEFQGRIGFAVEDDGVGFDPATCSAAPGSTTSPSACTRSAARSGSTRARARDARHRPPPRAGR
jgi:hypothetical protein